MKLTLVLWITSLLVLCSQSGFSVPDAEFFDDFSYNDAHDPAIETFGWQIRTHNPGAPGPTNAQWEADNLTFSPDPENTNNRLMTVSATAQGSLADPSQSEISTACRFREGTFAARLLWRDHSITGPDIDRFMQNFYALNSLRYDYDPDYSECDMEYLPHGGNGATTNVLYCTTWETYRADPWDPVAQNTGSMASHAGWHTLRFVVSTGVVAYFIDDIAIATHVGSDCPGDSYPESLMAIAFQTRFKPDGVASNDSSWRAYGMDVDWVYHSKDEALSCSNVEERVSALRDQGIRRRDTLTDANAPVQGRIAYYTLSDYLAEPTTSEDGQLFLQQLNQGSNLALTAGHPVNHAMHPSFSPNGDLLVFEGIPSGAPRTRASLELYRLDLAEGNLARLTTNAVPDETPAFHPEGTQIVFIREGRLWTLALASGVEERLEASPENCSDPRYSPDGQTILFISGVGDAADLWTLTPAQSLAQRLIAVESIQESHPSWRHDQLALFTRWNNSTDRHQKIYQYDIAAETSHRLWINTDEAHDQDGFPVNDDFIGFASDRTGGQGGFDLYWGQPAAGKTFKLGETANSPLNDLGGVYTPSTYARRLRVRTPPPNAVLTGGANILMELQAFSDGQAWTDATPRIRLEGPWAGNFWGFVDDGTSGDATAGDGIYSRTVTLPSIVGSYTIYALSTSTEPGLFREVTSDVHSLSIRAPPSIYVSPTNWNFGYAHVGSSKEAVFNVQNAGDGILTGAVSVTAPFAVLSGGSYSLPSGHTHAVTVRYSPVAAGAHSNDLLFTGGADASRPLLGIGYVPALRSLQVLTPGSNAILGGSSRLAMEVRASSDGQIWTQATPRIRLEGPWSGNLRDFMDEGSSGDALAGDGIYSRMVTLPSITGAYTVCAISPSVEPGLIREITSSVFSVFIVQAPALNISPSRSDSGLLFKWSSESNRIYHLYSSTNLKMGFPHVVASPIIATPSLNVYTDSSANAQSLQFYRVIVECP